MEGHLKPPGAEIDALNEMEKVYAERNAVVMGLARAAQELGWLVGWKADEKEPGWAIIYIDLPTGQASWHVTPGYPMPDWMGEYPDPWDGHDTPTKYEKLRLFVDGWPKNAPRPVVPKPSYQGPGIYRHWKGALIEVFQPAIVEVTYADGQEPDLMIIYRHLDQQTTWARTEEEFNAWVPAADGSGDSERRFCKVCDGCYGVSGGCAECARGRKSVYQ